jgi:nickel-dependent lactate racemase
MLNETAIASECRGITGDELESALGSSVGGRKYRHALIIPSDMTRAYSAAGRITNIYYHLLESTCEVDILPALGTHMPMTENGISRMFGDIPLSCFIEHNWRTDVVKVGEAPSDFVKEISEGVMTAPIEYQINRRLLDPSYDLIISVGQVVPHEVAGMANYTKNILVGCGGSGIINASHYLGAVYGMERVMGRDFSPVRRLFDYAQENFLKDLPLDYVLTVTAVRNGGAVIHGLFTGGGRKSFERAVALSQKKNITFIEQPLKKTIAYLDEEEFKSTWLGNKAIYRTRMAMADGGELVILAPGIERFGEDPEVDRLIRRYGYFGSDNIIEECDKNDELKSNLSAAAHMIHGASDGRFRITYCPGHLSEAEVRSVGFGYMPLEEAMIKYDPKRLREGDNTVDGEQIFFVRNPAVGLWACGDRF